MMEHEQHALLASILNTAIDAIIVIDEFGTIESANPATEKLFGFSLDELIGQNVKILAPSPHHEGHDGYLDHYRRTGEKRIIGVGRGVTGQRKDGTTFPLHLAVSEINAEGRKLFAGILRDISDLKKAENQLEELNEVLDHRVRQQSEALRNVHVESAGKDKLATLGQVFGGIAHEIRNPLNVVKTSVYYLLNGKSLSPEKVREHLERIDRQVTAIDTAITALTDVARLPTPQTQSCRIPDLLRSVVDGVSLGSAIKVETDFPETLPEVVADSDQLAIVFRNLIRNARDAMPDGGVLTLSGELDAGRVRVQVRDTGVGMHAETLSRINEPFFSTKAHGMGLGLAITNAILQKNRGTIEVESSLGQGATFSVSLRATETKESSDQVQV